MSTAMRTALGACALLLGGLLGGLLGSVLFGGRGSATSGGAPERVVVERDAELVDALRELTRELQVREASRERPSEPTTREPVQDDGVAPVPADYGDLVAAMDRLANALARTPAGSGGGIGVTQLALPPGGNRADRLRALLAVEDEEASRQFRLWNYQQVLDYFGQPDDAGEGGRWTYRLPEADGGREFTFRFSDGYLFAIYY